MPRLVAVILFVATALASNAVAGKAPTSRAPGSSAASVAIDSVAAARAILTRVGDAYRAMTRYRFEGTMKLAMSGQGATQTADIPFVVAAAESGRVRIEIRHPVMSVVRVSDGASTWNYISQLGRYTKKPVAAALDTTKRTLGASVDDTPVGRYFTIERNLVSCRLGGRETIEVAGTQVDCDVVQAQYAPNEDIGAQPYPYRFWIDRARGLVLREETGAQLDSTVSSGPTRLEQTTTFRLVSVDQPLPDSLFVFRPPAGAVLADDLIPPRAAPPDPSRFDGARAEDFTLSDLAGKPKRLTSWRGKVVLLDFWASWCGPCRREMPTIVKLHQRYKAKGLVVVGVNVGETAEVARDFARQNTMAFTVLLDRNSQISHKYGAVGIPTLVIIDRKGMISSHFVGMRSEEDLTAALRKVGLE